MIKTCIGIEADKFADGKVAGKLVKVAARTVKTRVEDWLSLALGVTDFIVE